MLSQDVPQRHFHCGQGGHQHRAPAPVRVAVNAVPVRFNVHRVLADQVFLDVFQSPQQRLFLIFQRCLPHAVDPLVGINLDEHPVRAKAVHHKGLDIRHFH